MRKVVLIYPPGKNFQRGEERCQINVDYSSANSLRACNDLGYIAACLKNNEYDVFLKDYQSEHLSLQNLYTDIKTEKPDVLFISTTNGSVFYDLEIVQQIKKIYPKILVILKGALFVNASNSIYNELDLSCVDYLIGVEAEFILPQLLDSHFNNKNLLADIQGISYKKNNSWVSNPIVNFEDKLDDLPFPARELMNNQAYINPENNKPMATICISRGCCYSCSYCLSPKISGIKIRKRKVENIILEITKCYQDFGIDNFFFKSDTFTTDRKMVVDICNSLIKNGLHEKITWVTTARVDTIDDEMLSLMKKAGCELLAFGFESGSNESLKNMKKGTTKEQNILAAKLCKKHNIRIFGYFLIGFPWENELNIKETEKHILDIDPDYIEISVVVPYIGTDIYNEIKEKNYDGKILGSDSYENIIMDYAKLENKVILKYKKKMLLNFYLRPKYILKNLKKIYKSPMIMNNYLICAVRLIKNNIF